MHTTDANVLLCFFCCVVVRVYCCRSVSRVVLLCVPFVLLSLLQVWGWDMPTGLHQLLETIVDSGIEKESVESAQQRAKFSVEALDGRGVFEIVDVEGMGNERPGHEETEKGKQERR